jgi:hypothetical protein
MSMELIVAINVVVAVSAIVLARFVLIRMARKRGVRIRDLIGPGGG